MARPLRIEYPSALYHVMSRGNQRRPIVADDVDRQKRLTWLRRTVETYGWKIHAFVLMTNHDHLFLETPEPNLSAGMQYLNGSYSGYFNARHRRCGHLFQGRFKSHLIETEGYYMAVSRYIHLNPVRAGVVGDPKSYAWSSLPGYVRATKAQSWVTYDRVLSDFKPGTMSRRRHRYRQFIDDGVKHPPVSPWRDAVAGLILGSEEFVAEIKSHLSSHTRDPELPALRILTNRPSFETIIAAVCAAFDEDEQTWGSSRRSDTGARAVAAYVSRRLCGYSATEVARALRYASISSVSHAVRKIQSHPGKYRGTLARVAHLLNA